ncbi:hypothetical protein [Streptomyces sp. NPDC002156]
MTDSKTEDTPPPAAPASSREKVVDENLAGIAKTLAGVFAAVAGVGTTFGISQENLLAAINNNPGRFQWVIGLGLGAVALSMASLFLGSSTLQNWIQVLVLSIGTGAYLAALYVALTGVADYATSHGRPNITNLSVVPGSPVKINFTVDADGVPNSQAVVVEAQGFKGEVALDDKPVYKAVLRPDGNGDIEQKLEVVWEAGEATRLTIQVAQGGNSEPTATCKPASDKLTCASILLPSAGKP